MDDFVHLGDSEYPDSQVPLQQDTVGIDVEVHVTPFVDLPPSGRTSRGRGARSGRVHAPIVHSPTPSQPVTKSRGPNWTELEMLVLIGQKQVEWDGRHNSNQPTLAKFVYGTTTWKLVLAGCMAVVGFRERDADQITNKWDGLVKDYKKMKDYIEGTGFADWWGMSRAEKKELSKTRKMSLEFSEVMFNDMEEFVGKRQVFHRGMDAIDNDRLPPSVPRQFGRGSTSSPASSSAQGAIAGVATLSPTPARSSAATSEARTDATPGSTGRKRRALGGDNLVDFVKDFNYDYLSRAELQDKNRRIWRSEVFAFDTAREARIAQKEVLAQSMDQKLYELKVQKTTNLGNMTSALLMMASSMDALTRGMLRGSSEGRGMAAARSPHQGGGGEGLQWGLGGMRGRNFVGNSTGEAGPSRRAWEREGDRNRGEGNSSSETE